jgi:ferredoxin-nitrate reductase
MIPDYSGMTYEKLLALGGIQWPCTEESPEGTVRLYEDRRFPSEWTRAEIYKRDLDTGHEHAPMKYRDRRDSGGRAFLVAAEYEPPVEQTGDEYPMTAISGRQVYHWHTRTKTAKSYTDLLFDFRSVRRHW